MRPATPRVSRWISCCTNQPAAAALLALALLITGLVFSHPAQAQYKWRDERGQLHVSDLPPPQTVPERQILQRPNAARRAPAAAPAASGAAPASPATAASAAARPGSAAPGVDPELARRRQQAEQAARQQAQADQQRQAEQRAQNCQRARQQLALYESGQRLQRVGPSGERVVVDDATRAQEVALAQRVVASDCR